MIVIDASALLESLLRMRAGTAVRDRLLAPGRTLPAPHLIDIVVAQLRRRSTGPWCRRLIDLWFCRIFDFLQRQRAG